MHFLIYIPEPNCPPDRLAEVGLPGLADGAFNVTTQGPDGKLGTLFSWRPVTGVNQHKLTLEYNAARQTWNTSAALGDLEAGRYWYGTINGNLPTPDDLQRQYPYRCHEVMLGDERQWWLPAERDIPQTVKLMDDGSYRYVPHRKYEEFCHLTRQWREIVKTLNVGVVIEEALAFVRLALGVNYRLTPEIESDLELWTTSNTGSIQKAFFGMLDTEEVYR